MAHSRLSFCALCADFQAARGTVKPLDAWTLSEPVTVSHAVGVLGEDVAKHADEVRNFRNDIHPRQQLKENFEPRIETVRIAQQVLRAALATFSRVAKRGERER